MGRAISHDALCDQWEAATVDCWGIKCSLAIWLIFIEMDGEKPKTIHTLHTDSPFFLYFGGFASPRKSHTTHKKDADLRVDSPPTLRFAI